MDKDPPPLDPDHEAKRTILSMGGLFLLAIGVPCGLIGAWRFVSIFFSGPFDEPPSRPAIGIIMVAAGGFLSMLGLQALAAGNMGRILRYKYGEMLPPTMDAARHVTPLARDLTKGLARSVKEGWIEGDSPSAGSRLLHSCGTSNDADDVFCKGCGQSLIGPVCPSCQAKNDADARFCDRCGATIAAGA